MWTSWYPPAMRVSLLSSFSSPPPHACPASDLTQRLHTEQHPYTDSSPIYSSSSRLTPELQAHMSSCLPTSSPWCLCNISDTVDLQVCLSPFTVCSRSSLGSVNGRPVLPHAQPHTLPLVSLFFPPTVLSVPEQAIPAPALNSPTQSSLPQDTCMTQSPQIASSNVYIG